MEKDVIKIDKFTETFKGLTDLVSFLTVYDSDNETNNPIPCLTDAESKEAVLLNDEEYNAQALARLNARKSKQEFHLAVNNEDFERLLIQHHARNNSLRQTKDNDIIPFIRGVELRKIVMYRAETDNLIDYNLSEATEAYLLFLENKPGVISQSSVNQLVSIPKEKIKKPAPTETLWDCIKPITAEIIKKQVELDSPHWGKYTYNYVLLWHELVVKGHIRDKYIKPKTSYKNLLVILNNTYSPKITFGTSFDRSRSGENTRNFHDYVTGKIPEFIDFEKPFNEDQKLYGDYKDKPPFEYPSFRLDKCGGKQVKKPITFRD